MASCFFYEQGIPQVFIESAEYVGFEGNTESEQDEEIEMLEQSFKERHPLSIHFVHRAKTNIPDYMIKVARVFSSDESIIEDVRRRQIEELKPERLARTKDELKDKDFRLLDKKQRRAYRWYRTMWWQRYPDDVVDNQKKIWTFLKNIADVADVRSKQGETLKPDHLARMALELKDKNSDFLNKRQRVAYNRFDSMRRQKYPDDVIDNQKKIWNFFKKLADDKKSANRIAKPHLVQTQQEHLHKSFCTENQTGFSEHGDMLSTPFKGHEGSQATDAAAST
eukprot:gnl/TRDRNA2_/TRDRNA2_174576_c0_seq11.p1 gnl/TRDRNA2_/TRDRNA2_174576_c0~~gnl/TRDRNA2_/TRDRNA2_174576_c0_seq11.p1  ORF type:complete len:280 (+),score=54.30 gnl/TRDRNA2_/TRDRNA2_174576_c0_seq11:2-841(+)